MTVTIPPNTSATARLPEAVSEQVTEGGQVMAVAEGVRQVRQEGNTTIIEVGSGTYTLAYPYEANG